MSTKEIALAKTRDALTEHRLDAMVASSPANVCYTAGTFFRTMISIPDRLGMVSVPADGEPALIYCTIEIGHARDESWLTNLVGYTEFADRPIDVLARMLTEQGCADGRIGLEMRHLSAGDYERLVAALPRASFVPVDAVFDRIRAVKTPAEIDLLADAARKTDAAIRAGFASARIGDTELDVAAAMIAAAQESGALKVHHHTLATGAHGFKTHAEAGTTTLRPGDVLRTDLGMTWPGHYLSDVAHVAFVGEVSPAQSEMYKKLESVQQEVGSAMRPGMLASDVFRQCRKTFAEIGLDFSLPHVGHSIGLGLHENPMFHPFDDSPLETGMIFMLEPLVRGLDGLYHVEDMIEITETGSRVLSRTADWSEPMVVA
jgi:Xaa-Pro aminopeptidase